MLADRVQILSLLNYKPEKIFHYELTQEFEPTILNARQVFEDARKNYRLRGQGYVMNFGDASFYISRGPNKGQRQYNITFVGDERHEPGES